MKRNAIVIAALLMTSMLVTLVPVASSVGTLRLMAVGDTSTTSAAQKNVDAAVAEGAQGFVGLGDYNYDSSVSTWKSMFAPLTSKAAYMAIGNHDDRSQFADLMPDGTRWSKSVNGVRIVALNGMSSIDTARLRSDLCNAPEATRIVIVHHNWWLLSAAHHPGSEFPTSASTMDAIMKDCGVDLVLAGHEHNYQRMVRNGVDYVIAGTGGRGLYPIAGVPSGTVVTYAGYGRVVLDLSPTGFSATFKTLDGTVKDTFSSGSVASPTPSPTPSPSPSTAPTFAPNGGNEWWVQVAVSGSPMKVEARDTGGSYVPLAKKSWGDWAASFHVEAGHDVQYRATFADGNSYESCWFDHPKSACTSGGTTTPTPTTPTPTTTPSTAPTFAPKGGNEWWVQVDVSGSPTKVEARDTGGSYVPLAKKSWGDWAASFHVEAGHDVQYRATFADGNSYESCWFDHPRPTCASGTPTTAPPATGTSDFTATYRNIRGNAYWVETDVSVAGGTLDHVEARVNDANWVPLDHKSWGSWAKSMRAPTGSTVELRSVATGGQTSAPFAVSWPPAA